MANCETEVVYSFDADLVMIKTGELVSKCLLPENREKLMQVLQRKALYATTQTEMDEVVGFLKKIDERQTALGKEKIDAALHLCEKSRLMRKVIRGMVTVDEIPLNGDVVELMQYYHRNRKKVIIITKNEETDLIGELARKNGIEGVPIFLEHGDKSARVEKLGKERGWSIVHCDNEHKESFEKRFGSATPHFVLAGEQLEFHSLKNRMDSAASMLSGTSFSKNLRRDSQVGTVPMARDIVKPLHVK